MSETNMMRYITKLGDRDYGLAHGMIPLGSCTMKLNSAHVMHPITYPGFAKIHPFAPKDQTIGYTFMIRELEKMLTTITHYHKISLQPNSGANGEFAGLLSIVKYHQSRNDVERKICLIPTSAHGTNPASASMCGLDIVGINCDARGNIDVEDFKAKIQKYGPKISCAMFTYPSTFGVFEDTIQELCEMVHNCGGMVYLDGANMNAQMGLTSPGKIGADVGHLNLHKTFAIPHGGGGPGIGAIGCVKALAPFLPGHSVVPINGNNEGAVTAAPYGNAGVLPITYAYIRLCGARGLLQTSQEAILNANYMAERLKDAYSIKFRGTWGRVAHEFIINLNSIKKNTGITEEDVAKRLMDYGFHAPTMSWPLAGGLMIEPTESEDKAEIDRFCDAMLRIREEIRDIEEGRADRNNNMLKNAPHTLKRLMKTDWDYPYTREQAAYPAPWVYTRNKVWPTVSRVDSTFGDRNPVCECPSVTDFIGEEYQQ